ncbi:MAG TPA: ATP-binding cassette domain-containing protein, partial [Puia sp.]|nr:ATP-binding cassette domain-containing protein [Puia sp.]
ILASLKGASKHFGPITIVENASAEIDRGDKIALIGANGKGKSTLLRMVAGTEPFEGQRVWGHNVEESFYAQHQLESLNVNNTLLEEMQLCGSQKTDLELRVLLGCFLFSGDDVEKKIRVLSGGEKARVALAKTIISKANFLLLDEPTNHLDMHSCDLLIEALTRYEGSYLLVSHDRYFISRTANKIWEIEDGLIREFKGTYEEWVDWKERNLAAKQQAAVAAVPVAVAAPPPPPPVPGPPSDRPRPSDLGARPNKEAKKELQRQQRLFQDLEQKIATLTRQKDALEASLADPATYSDKNKFIKAETDYKKTSDELDKANRQYEQVFEKIMELEKTL